MKFPGGKDRPKGSSQAAESHPTSGSLSRQLPRNSCVGTYGLELYTDLVFSVGIQLVFLGIYQTDTAGKLGQYILVLLFWQEPLFSSKGGSLPPF